MVETPLVRRHPFLQRWPTWGVVVVRVEAVLPATYEGRILAVTTFAGAIGFGAFTAVSVLFLVDVAGFSLAEVG